MQTLRFIIRRNSLLRYLIFDMFLKYQKQLLQKINATGNTHQCYICKNTFNGFTKYRGGTKNKSEFSRLMQTVGSNIDHFGCMYCGCHDRARHIFMYFDKLNFWEEMTDANILHFAPEINLQNKIELLNPNRYIKGDLYPYKDDQIKIDITNIPFENDYFDLVISNHVLEHIPNYIKALKEVHRVLKPGGIAILQTPYSNVLKYNFELSTIKTDYLKLKYYGQEDHVRYFSGKQLFKSIEKVGFKSHIKKHQDLFNKGSAHKFGVNMNEDLLMFEKVNNL